MIEVNGITCFLTIKDSRSLTALNQYNHFVNLLPDNPALYGHIVDNKYIEAIQTNNTLVSELTIAW